MSLLKTWRSHGNYFHERGNVKVHNEEENAWINVPAVKTFSEMAGGWVNALRRYNSLYVYDAFYFDVGTGKDKTVRFLDDSIFCSCEHQSNGFGARAVIYGDFTEPILSGNLSLRGGILSSSSGTYLHECYTLDIEMANTEKGYYVSAPILKNGEFYYPGVDMEYLSNIETVENKPFKTGNTYIDGYTHFDCVKIEIYCYGTVERQPDANGYLPTGEGILELTNLKINGESIFGNRTFTA